MVQPWPCLKLMAKKVADNFISYIKKPVMMLPTVIVTAHVLQKWKKPTSGLTTQLSST